MRVLVTGGAGYIGSVTAWRLAQQGHKPIVFDDLSTGHIEAARFGEFVRGDLCKVEDVDGVFRRHKPEAVMHFAARSLVPESVSNPRRYFHDNLIGAINLTDAIQKFGLCPMIFSSTAATYGNPIQVPIPESHPQIPINPYGETKLAIERMLVAYDRAYGLRYAILRYFNAAGAVPDEGLGECHDPETHLIPLVLQVPLGMRASVKIFGRNYATRDGTCERDYIHVVDLADAHIAALKELAKGHESMTFNLGAGTGNTVLEVIDLARRITGHPLPAEDAEPRAGDPPVLVASIDHAAETLHWRPNFNLATTIESAWKFVTSKKQ